MHPLRHYREIWCADFEFGAPPGGRPEPRCVVAREVRTGRLVKAWLDGAVAVDPVVPAGPDVLFVAFYASAELGCYLALNWPMPARVLDLFVEFRNHTNGTGTACGAGLLGALVHFGLDGIDSAEKDAMRDLALRGGPYSGSERGVLLDYCQSDVDALIRLLPRMLPVVDLPRALLRGRYMVAAARMEWCGVPIDADTFGPIQTHWSLLRTRIVREVNRSIGVYVPTDRPRVDPTTAHGAAVYDAAKEFRVDPDALAEAADYLHRQDCDATAARREAIAAARRATGLTPNRMGRLVGRGKDHPDVVGLDVAARELAGTYPDLGIGRGYDPDAPDEDNSQRLWDLLARPDPKVPPRNDAGFLRRAADLLGPDGGQDLGDRPLSFSTVRFSDYLIRHKIPWPRLGTGRLDLSDDAFKEMARAYPDRIGPVRDMRTTLGEMRAFRLAVGDDGRNRTLLSVFRSRTGRNQPSNSQFIFGPSAWLRSLIRPRPGRAVAYVDWSQQELAIAAALSGDPGMRDAYTSGDFYLAFAKMAGAVPAGATKQTHAKERDQFKTVALGVLFGLGADSLARKIGEPPYKGRELLGLHRRAFPRFWAWIEDVETAAMLTGTMRTVFGWTLHLGPDVKPTAVRNFPMQANGAEMMRLAACLATERGVEVCCPVHDAFLIEADDDRIDIDTTRMQVAMRDASELVLPGFPLKTDAKIVRYPDRYSDPRGEKLWAVVQALLADVHSEREVYLQ